MRTGAAADHVGYFHEALCYESDQQFLDVAVPFLREGVSVGEPTIVALATDRADLIRRVLPRAAELTYLDPSDSFYRPATTIRARRELMGHLLERGAPQIRLLGELPPTAFGPTWDWWARYESATNHVFDDFPLWSICAYHAGTTPAGVLREVTRCHPWTAGPDGPAANSNYLDPVDYLNEPPTAPDDPLQGAPPRVELTNPMPADARQAILASAPAGLSETDLDGFVTAASEAVTNGIRHGRGPVQVRLWTGPARMVLTVEDHGPGPKDPFAGLRPHGTGREGGLGLWLCHQLCSHVSMRRHENGFTIRLTAGNLA